MNNKLQPIYSIVVAMTMIIVVQLLSFKDQHSVLVAQEIASSAEKPNHTPQSLIEAKTRARILHETIRGALQVMHRDFFDEEESLAIPSHSLEDVFEELEKVFDVKIEWLAVNAKAMNIDNIASDDFQKDAVKILSTGKETYESEREGRYHFAGAIRLHTQCLKCHLPSRTTNNVRTAALVISMPFRNEIPAK